VTFHDSQRKSDYKGRVIVVEDKKGILDAFDYYTHNTRKVRSHNKKIKLEEFELAY